MGGTAALYGMTLNSMTAMVEYTVVGGGQKQL